MFYNFFFILEVFYCSYSCFILSKFLGGSEKKSILLIYLIFIICVWKRIFLVLEKNILSF